MYGLLRQLMFMLPPETSHGVGLRGIDILQRAGLSSLFSCTVPADPVTLMGVTFPNPVGLAAGLDKNAEHIDGLAALGFGFIEVGTVTPRPQPGNPRPRLFRLPAAQAIINRMGFNNHGVDHLVREVSRARYRGVLGINIGKNFDTPVERAVDDYLICMQKVYPLASYVTVNLSSPNTPGLRDLQFGEPLKRLLERLRSEQQRLATQHGRYVPLLIKIAPDMDASDVQQVAAALLEFGIDGVIATNTTITRDGVEHLRHGNEKGGLSGAPVRDRSTAVIRMLREALGEAYPIIGVGGIMSGDDAAEKIRAGANLIQIYTGFIYRGGSLISEAAEAVRRCRDEQKA
jgi:dihydroorotate dehydrogenase